MFQTENQLPWLPIMPLQLECGGGWSNQLVTLKFATVELRQ